MSAVHYFTYERVQVWMIDAPALWLHDSKTRRNGLIGCAGNSGFCIALADFFARFIKDGSMQNYFAVTVQAIAQLDHYCNRAHFRGDFRRDDVRSPMHNVNRAGYIEPHIAIDASSWIPA